jgi:hypothetical protein
MTKRLNQRHSCFSRLQSTRFPLGVIGDLPEDAAQGMVGVKLDEAI